MKKISVFAALTMTGLVIATPAHADGGDNLGGRRVHASHQNPLATNLCERALALVPLAAPWTGQEVRDACDNRDHSDFADR
jgi:hypothetical protein